MERQEWLQLEHTKELIQFLKNETVETAMSAAKGRMADPNNSDKTQYKSGQTLGLICGYAAVMEHVTGRDKDSVTKEEMTDGAEYSDD
jgi:hypothetical protein